LITLRSRSEDLGTRGPGEKGKGEGVKGKGKG
jgi:hypothetical protein